jgi:hypothetical protein
MPIAGRTFQAAYDSDERIACRSVADLNFGDYIYMLADPDQWKKLAGMIGVLSFGI